MHPNNDPPEPSFSYLMLFSFSVSSSFQSENYISSYSEIVSLIVSIPISQKRTCLFVYSENPLLPVCSTNIFLYLFHKWLWKANSCSENVILRLLTQEFAMLTVWGWTLSTLTTRSTPGKVQLVQWDVNRDRTLSCQLLFCNCAVCPGQNGV